MLLVIRSKLKRRLSFDALMTIPEKKEISGSRSLPRSGVFLPPSAP
jgi:hypothetical protein